MTAAIPIVDLSLPEAAAAATLGSACRESGFFLVSGHGVQDDLVNSMFDQLKKAFGLPLEDKMAMLQDENNRGYTPMQEETLDPAAQTQGDTKEGFYFGREVPAGSPEAQLPLHGPNVWPPEQLLPGFRRSTEDYFSAMAALGARLLRLLALSLQLPAGFFDRHFDPPMTFLRPLHYSPDVSRPSEGVFGAGAHSDYGMLTILATDGQPGLQVFLDGEWVDAPYVPRTFICNLGDMLERWTNGLYRSTLHRVVSSTGKDRYSIPFFFEPNFNAVVECLPSCVSEERPAGYPPTTAGQHLLGKYASTHAGYHDSSSAADGRAGGAAAGAGGTSR